MSEATALEMEKDLSLKVQGLGYTLVALPDPLDDKLRRLAISAPGKVSRGCSYAPEHPRAIKAAYRCMVDAAEESLPKEKPNV